MSTTTSEGKDDTTRIIMACPVCHGEREHEVWTGYDPRDGSATGYREVCTYCEGKGEVEEDATPVMLADLEEIGVPYYAKAEGRTP